MLTLTENEIFKRIVGFAGTRNFAQSGCNGMSAM